MNSEGNHNDAELEGKVEAKRGRNTIALPHSGKGRVWGDVSPFRAAAGYVCNPAFAGITKGCGAGMAFGWRTCGDFPSSPYPRCSSALAAIAAAEDRFSTPSFS